MSHTFREMMARAAVGMCLFLSLLLFGCATQTDHYADPLDACIERLDEKIKAAPMQRYLMTLDGQKVQLDEFFQQSLMRVPMCTLPDKFYHWEKEVRSVTSRTPDGDVNHKVRIYFNYLSTCDPIRADAKKTHGDIAEFYDTEGQFMGLIVYAGDGLYCPLPYSKYSGKQNQLRLYMYQRKQK